MTHARIPEVQQRCSPTCSQEKLTPLGGGLVGLCEVRPSRSHELLHQDAALAKVWALASGNRLRALSRLPSLPPARARGPRPPRPDGRPRARRIHRDAGALSATDGLRDRPQLWLGAEVDGPTSPKEVEGPHPGGPRTPSEPSAARDWATLEKVRPPYTRRAVSAFRKPPRVAPHRKPCQQSSYRNVRKSYIH